MLHNNIDQIAEGTKSEVLILIAEDANRRCLGVTDEQYVANQQKIVTACMNELAIRVTSN